MFHVAHEDGVPVGPTDAAIANAVIVDAAIVHRPVPPRRSVRWRRLCPPRLLGTLALTSLYCIGGTTPGVAGVAGDASDEPIVAFAVNQALERERSGVTIPWSNTQTGRSGSIILETATYAQPDRPCRGYRRTIEQPGFTPAEVRGTGCRIGPALWAVEETIVTVAVAVVPPSPAPSAVSAPPPSRKASPTGVATRKPASDPPTASRTPSLPAYTLPSKAGS